MTKFELTQIVRHLALPVGTTHVAVDEDGELSPYPEKPRPREDISYFGGFWHGGGNDWFNCRGDTLCILKPQPNWRELVIRVEGE